MTSKKNKQKGHSLIEMVVALGIFAMMISLLMIFSGNGLGATERSAYYTKALAMLDETEEALQNIGENNWNSLNIAQAGISTSSGYWRLDTVTPLQEAGNYTRTVMFENVYRDSENNMVSSDHQEAWRDVMSTYALIHVGWSVPDQRPIDIERKILLTYFNAKQWTQSDWSLGSGETFWRSDGYYLASDLDVSVSGRLSLSRLSTSSYESVGFLESSAFYARAGNSFSVIGFSESEEVICGACRIELRIKTAEDQGGLPATWSSHWSGPDGDDGDADDYYRFGKGEMIHLDHRGEPWLKYQLQLFGDGSSTPIFNDISIYYH